MSRLRYYTFFCFSLLAFSSRAASNPFVESITTKYKGVFQSNQIRLNKQATVDTSGVKRFIAYVPGLYTPFGLMYGFLTSEGCGFYSSFRFNQRGFKSHQYTMDVNGIKASDEYIFQYNGNKYYGRWDLTAGITKMISGGFKNPEMYYLFGVGVSRFRYLYEFNSYKESGKEEALAVVSDNKSSNFNINIEGIVMLNFTRWHVQMGGLLGVSKFNESMILTGLGFNLP